MLPRVRELHDRFADVMDVIGVHAGKFATERHTDRIDEACDRLGVYHPVVNDHRFRVWHDYAVKAWPTVALVDPSGHLVGVQPGEFDIDAVAKVIQRLVTDAAEKGTLRRGPGALVMPPLSASRRSGLLRFPTRCLSADGVLWVADTGNRRVLACRYDPSRAEAEVVTAYEGLGEPRGLAALDGRVYVADRAAHSVYALLDDGTHHRVAGTGAIEQDRIEAGDATHTSLRSPWGLAVLGSRLAITMAGAHQLWALDPASGALGLLAGSGLESLEDGAAPDAALAQPTGTAAYGSGLAFADCESSAIRLFEGARGRVSTLVGTGLFDFGDRPGVGDAALLQHCEDVALHRGMVAVADTYNDRLKLLDPDSRECVPWPGEAGEAGALREPGGLFSDGRDLLVADTGNHRLVRVEEDGRLTEVRFE